MYSNLNVEISFPMIEVFHQESFTQVRWISKNKNVLGEVIWTKNLAALSVSKMSQPGV